MHTFSKKKIREYGDANAQAKEDLNIWYAQLEAADWKDFNALKEDFPSCDYLGNDRYCFNIKGNHYRLIAMIFFLVKQVYIRGIFTHAEYTKLSKKNKLIDL